jgi:hypothetical protein
MKYLKTFENFLLEYRNGPNLAIDTNPRGSQWYNDGITGSEVPEPYHYNIKNIKRKKGSTADKEIEKRRKDRKEKAKQQKIEFMAKNNLTDDIATYSNIPLHSPTTNAGGRAEF